MTCRSNCSDLNQALAKLFVGRTFFRYPREMLCSEKRAHAHHSLLWLSKVFMAQGQLLRRLLIRFRIRKLETNGNGVLRNLPNQCLHPTPLPNW